MLAMQYSIQLAPNFSAEKIRKRVSERGALFDSLPGLAHKSFLYSEADNLYAPFYIWEDLRAARQFLLDGLFKGVVETFRRHRVRSWMVLDMAHGVAAYPPTFALREVDAVAPEERLDAFLRRERAQHRELLADPGLYFHAMALDAERWEVMRFSLWRNRASAVKPMSDCFQSYEVLHVSEPAGVHGERSELKKTVAHAARLGEAEASLRRSPEAGASRLRDEGFPL